MAQMPLGIVMAFLGQTFIQHPQATQVLESTAAFLAGIFFVDMMILLGYDFFIVYSNSDCRFSDKVTLNYGGLWNFYT
jgi:hypothetical protein